MLRQGLPVHLEMRDLGDEEEPVEQQVVGPLFDQEHDAARLIPGAGLMFQIMGPQPGFGQTPSSRQRRALQ
ncbi:hypothetical protein P775_01395 [Puniceibacterium antarcticum]|uniref:Uncharacterized protein n=1 Tax=Puniceibacterium antarcticum TaxID=1206336 RepID=A0A2G8RK86_9RHOB|nr:hypothetical protein P775_01395 [Puniceibacterium antarcticum]